LISSITFSFAYDQERTFTALSKYKDASEAGFLSPRANATLKKSQTPEIEAQFNATLEKYGAFLRQTIALICPKDVDSVGYLLIVRFGALP